MANTNRCQESQRSSKEEAEEPSTIEGAKAKAKAEAVATAKRLLAKAQAMRFTTQEVE